MSSASVSAAERAALAAGAGGASASSDRAGLRSVSKTSMGFEVLSVCFNPHDEQQLLVVGFKDLVVLTLGARGDVTSRIIVDLMLDSLGLSVPVHLIKATWLPGSPSQCVVLTNQFCKVYDLARDKISPIHYFQVLDDPIKDVAFVHTERAPPPPLPPASSAAAASAAAAPATATAAAATSGGVVLLAITASGMLFSQPLATSDATNGPHLLTDALHVASDLRGRVGFGLHYSAPCALLFTIYADGRCFALRLNESATDVQGGFAIQSARPDYLSSGSAALAGPKASAVPYSHLVDVPGQRGTLVACCRKTLAPVAMRITTNGVELQALKPLSKAEGVAVASAPSSLSSSSGSGSSVCWVLHEDGSMQCHTCGVAADSEIEFAKALGCAYAKAPPARPTFPVDFFERGTCVTANPEISFSGDVTHNSTADNAKARLSSNTDDYVSSPHRNSLTLHVHNSQHDQMLIGVRLLLGSAHPQHIPASFTLFKRTITTQEGQRRWYDVPFTETESIIAQHQLTIQFSGTHGCERSCHRRGRGVRHEQERLRLGRQGRRTHRALQDHYADARWTSQPGGGCLSVTTTSHHALAHA